MTFFGQILIQLAGAILTVWAFIKTLFGWIGSGLDAILQPVMSPVLRILNPLCTAIADAAYKLLSPFPPWVGLVLISAFAGVVMLIAFRYLSNQVGIARAKDDIKANLLALKLFKDDLGVALRAQARIMWALVRLQRYMLVPILWMALPTMLLLSQMAMRYQWRPFVRGETVLLKVHFPSPTPLVGIALLDPPSGVEVEVGPIADDDDFSWRMRALQPGRHLIPIKVDTEMVEKELVVGSPIQRVSPVRPHSRWTAQLLYPIEPVISSDPTKSIESVEIVYPELKSRIHGSDYWVLTFFIVSMLTAILLKPLFKVRF